MLKHWVATFLDSAGRRTVIVLALSAFVATGCSQNGAPAPASAAVKTPAASAASKPESTTRVTNAKADGNEAAAPIPSGVPPHIAGALARSAQDQAAANAPELPAIEPPDGVWLVDDNGAQFYIERMEKYEGKYKWLNDHQVIYLGVRLEVVGEDDETLHVKVYRPQEVQRPKLQKSLSEAEKLSIAESYRSIVGTTDRLSFERIDSSLPDSGQWRNGFVIADINGDHVPDIVHSPPRKAGDWPVSFLGDGKGGWTFWRSVSFPRVYDYGDVAVGDFNRDGHADIALAIHLRGLRVLIGDGQGKFTEWSDGIDYEIPGQGGDGAVFSSRALTVVDWDGDGWQDVLALGEGPRLASGGRPTAAARTGQRQELFIADGPTVYLNQGNGSWKKKSAEADARQVFGDSIVQGDFNSDGRPDFAVGSNRMGRKEILYINTGNGDWSLQALPLLRPNAFVRAVTVADFDGDGRDDLAAAYQSYELTKWWTGIDVFLSRAEGAWERRVLIARENRVGIYAVDAGDIDGDKHADVAATDADGNMLVFLGDGRGGFERETAPELDQARGLCRGYRLRIADVNGDGRGEVIANYADEANAWVDATRCPNGGGVAAFEVRR